MTEPQKRGRKKKDTTESEKEPKVKKKRGRKAALKFFSSSIRKKIPITSNTNNENVILHLDVKDSDENTFAGGINCTEECEIKPVNESNSEFTPFEIHTSTNPSEVQQEQKSQPPPGKHRNHAGISVLSEFVDCKDWKVTTNIHCWWCCHLFDDTPIGMPLRFVNNKFKVKGCFCSIACTLAWYNNSKYRTDPKIFTLIKNLHRKLTGGGSECKIYQAPPRESLIMFGGEMTIDEFRKSSDNGIVFKMIDYPMIIAKEFIEEIDLNNLKIQNENGRNGGGMIIMGGTHKQEDKKQQLKDAKIRLSQIEKPLTENTIDKFLNLKISNP
jgi:hypothetical protein